MIFFQGGGEGEIPLWYDKVTVELLNELRVILV